MKKKILSLIISSILVIGGGTVSIFNRTKNDVPSKVSDETKTVEDSSEDVVASSDSQIATQESNEQTKANESASEVNTVKVNKGSANTKTADSNSNSSKNDEVSQPTVNDGQASTDNASSNDSKNTSTNSNSENSEKKSTNSNSKSNSTSNGTKNTANSSTTNGMPVISQNHSVEFLSQVENEILTLCNNERAKSGLKPLSMDENMRKAARYKAEEMLQYGYFDHNSPYTGSPFQLLQKFNVSYSTAGENIQSSTGLGKASVTAQDIVNRWMNSAGHRANILNANFGRMGIGVAFSSDGNLAYESQLFAN